MQQRVSFAVVVLLLVASAHAHTWMSNPKPASGGGTSASQASTASPCGLAKPSSITTVTAVVQQTATGVQMPVSWMKANPHGLPYTDTWNLCAQTPANCASNAAFTTNVGATANFADPNSPTDSSTSFTSSRTITIPPGVYGKVLLQYVGTLSGGPWYDCAYVNILNEQGVDVSAGTGSSGTSSGGSSGNVNPCVAHNPCNAKAYCTTNSNNQATCACQAGYYGSGITCTLITSSMILQVAMTVAQTNVNSTFAGAVQNKFTANLATLLGFPAAQIAYDHATQLPNGNAVLFFALYPDPITGAVAQQQVDQLSNLVNTADPSLNSGLQFTVVDMSAQGGQPTCYGGCSGSSDSSSSMAWVAGPVVGGLAGMALIALAVVYYKRRSDSGYTGSSKYSSKEGAPSASTSSYQQPASASTTTVPVYFTWTTHRDEQGHIYYFNRETGESRWEKPSGASVAPLGSV